MKHSKRFRKQRTIFRKQAVAFKKQRIIYKMKHPRLFKDTQGNGYI